MIACFECTIKKHTYIMEVDGRTKSELTANAKKLARLLDIKKQVPWKLIWGTVGRLRVSEAES